MSDKKVKRLIPLRCWLHKEYISRFTRKKTKTQKQWQKQKLESRIKYLFSQDKLPDNAAEPRLRRDYPGTDGTALLTLEGGFIIGSLMNKD